MARKSSSFGFMGMFGRSHDLRQLDKALRAADLHPMLVPEGVKLATVNLMKDAEGGEPPDHAYPYVADMLAFCVLGANGFAGANGIERLEAVEARMREALEVGDGLDAGLVLLALHARLLNPGLVAEYGISAENEE